MEDASSKEYLSEEEALKFEPLTNVQNIVSMNQSTVKILGMFSLSFFPSFFLSVFLMQPIETVIRVPGESSGVNCRFCNFGSSVCVTSGFYIVLKMCYYGRVTMS